MLFDDFPEWLLDNKFTIVANNNINEESIVFTESDNTTCFARQKVFAVITLCIWWGIATSHSMNGATAIEFETSSRI